MLKMGIYGLLRVISLLGAATGLVRLDSLRTGLVSGVLGVLWALSQQDLKRVLAYSSVENIGIILLGMGVGVLGVAYGQPVVAVLGFTGAVLHTLNHALFKSLLFLGAGAVVRIDRDAGHRPDGRAGPPDAADGGGVRCRLGGDRRPAAAQRLRERMGGRAGPAPRGAGSGAPAARSFLAFAGLGLIGALALACFSRVAGGVFLGQPRGRESERPR